MTEKRLLVVDDKPEMGELVRRVADNLGYEVKVTIHGEDFMRVFDSFDPTTVVLDIVMPNIDGIELVKWLNDRGCRANVLVASAYNPNYAEMAESLGKASGLNISFIQKPFRVADLRAALS